MNQEEEGAYSFTAGTNIGLVFFFIFAVKQILDLIGKESVGGKVLQSMTSSTESVQ